MSAVTDDDLRERTQTLLAEVDHRQATPAEFRGAQFDRGLAAVHFPVGKGGLASSPKGQGVINEELRLAGVRYSDMAVNPIGIGMGMPTVLTWGTDEMHERHLRRIFTGEDIWCQMFSEPTHGSDVAGLASRAVRDGDEWVVNGQKVWTSLAHRSSWGMLLVRTDPEQPKHAGLSYFIVDMSSPGIEVRPLHQITGEAEFNEVFFTDVRLPHANMLGNPGDGWKVAITTLMNERVALGGGGMPRGGGPAADLVKMWTARRDQLPGPHRAAMRDRVAGLWIRAEVLRLTSLRARSGAKQGTPGPEGSVGKLASAELNKDIYEAVVDLMGAEGMLHPAGYAMVRPGEVTSMYGAAPTKSFLRSRANTIEGGTSEVMRNILGERVLGLPGDIRVDKEVSWTDIPR